MFPLFLQVIFWKIAKNAQIFKIKTRIINLFYKLPETTKVKCYSLKIYDNDYLVRDFIPCRRKIDNAVGIYDRVNNIFYELNNRAKANKLFNATIGNDKNSVILNKGIMFAYGYFGILPEPITIPFIKTSATQYRYIYAEIDRSVVPNTFTIKVKNNQGSDRIKPTTFRQDYLSIVKTGIFQLPLWRVELNNQGIVELKDVRDLRNYIMKVEHTDNTTEKVTGEISPLATATTQPITDNSEKLATTNFVHLATREYIDGSLPLLYDVSVEIFENDTQGTIITPNNVVLNCLNPTEKVVIEIKDGYEFVECRRVGNIEIETEKQNNKIILTITLGNYFPTSNENASVLVSVEVSEVK